MRCNNCGWENPDGNQRCEKCNAPLQGVGLSNQNANLHSTVREDIPFEPRTPKPEDHTVMGTIAGETLAGSVPPIQEQQYVSTVNDSSQMDDLHGTVNPYAGMGGYVPIPRCVLKPVIFPGEDTRYAPKPVNIKGNSSELNRQLLDPDNNTITSKVQAILTNKGGKWFIQNQSSQKTTYVYAGEPIEVKSGDIILMGNRPFFFEED